MQRTLVRGTAGELSDTGGLRNRIVVIGAPGRGFDDARFVPPPHGDQLRAGVESLLAWMQAPPHLPTVLQAAMAHYQFETLHPYSDGNGRLVASWAAGKVHLRLERRVRADKPFIRLLTPLLPPAFRANNAYAIGRVIAGLEPYVGAAPHCDRAPRRGR